MSATYPTMLFEMDFTNDPTSTTFTWTDITDYVDDWSISGNKRNYEQDKSETGTASLVLRNVDGRFDPSNTSGPYYGGGFGLIPMRRVQITATWLGTPEVLFTGFVLRFPQTWRLTGAYGVTTISAVDGFRVLQGYKFGKAYTDAVIADGARFLWTLNEPTSSLQSSSSVSPGTDDEGPALATFVSYLGTPVDTTALVAGSAKVGKRSVNGVDATVGAVMTSGNAIIRSLTDWAVEIVARPSTIPTDDSYADAITWVNVTTTPFSSNATNGFLRYSYPASGPAQYLLTVATTLYAGGAAVQTVVPIASSAVPVAGRSDHWLITHVGTTVTAYLNGVVVGTATLTAGRQIVTTAANRMYVGAKRTAPNTHTLEVADLAIYTDRTVAADRAADHALAVAVRREFEASTADVLIGRVLDAEGWPSSQRDIDTGTATLQALTSVDGRTALDIIQSAANDDLGNLFIDGSGRVSFRNRISRLTGSAAATFGEEEIPYLGSVVIDYDDQYIYNDVTVTTSGTTPYSARRTDAASIDRYFPRPLLRTVAYVNAADVDAAADQLLSRLKDAHLRVPTIEVNMAANPALFANLGLINGQRVTFTRRPRYASTISFASIIEGRDIKGGPNTFTVTYRLAPTGAVDTYALMAAAYPTYTALATAGATYNDAHLSG